MSALDGYFVAPDANDDLYLWRERGDYPVPIVGTNDLRDDPAVWELIVAAATPQTPLERAQAAAEALTRAVDALATEPGQ
jgi:hypothetical protein